MTHLYEALSWTIDEPGRPREYVIHWGGEVLANVTRVAIPRPDDAAMPYGNPHAAYDETRTVVCVAGPDRTPYFYVDRTNDPMRPRPAFVVAPNGGLIGSVAVSTGGVKGAFKLLSGRRGARFALLDATGVLVATMTGAARANPGEEATITDPNGATIARYSTGLSATGHARRRHTMRLDRPLPEPGHTLVLASLIGVELMTPAL
jgi:hypothetical protein